LKFLVRFRGKPCRSGPGSRTTVVFPLMQVVDGDTRALKAQQLKRLETTFRRTVGSEPLLTLELGRHLATLSRELGRQIGVLIDRGGTIRRVVLGEPSRLYLPDLGRTRGGLGRFRGLRLVRTELRGQGFTREDEADLSKLRLDAIVVVDVDPKGHPVGAFFGHLVLDPSARTVSVAVRPVRHYSDLTEAGMAEVRDAEAQVARFFQGDAREVDRGSVLLVSVWASERGARRKADESMQELQELARTAGARVVGTTIQIRRQVDPRTVLGKGKIEELTLEALELGAETLIFDQNLAPSQLRAITNATDLRVLDRTQLILDIFAKHAKTRDGKLQVELAQLKYALPRLVEKSTAMSRLTGGIGGQGPGETRLEIHRRRARDRIHRLEAEMGQISQHRSVQRQRRKHTGIPVVSIVGYTNAGKSTLLNRLTHSSVETEDKLFVTLDPTTRRVRFPKDREIILTDTVGFIRDLPKDLVSAFKSTLEELSESDVILHVVDASDANADDKKNAVDAILEQLGLSSIQRVVVLNKADQTPPPMMSALRRVYNGLSISAQNGTGLPELVAHLEDLLFHPDGHLIIGGPTEATMPEMKPAQYFV
jgi:GTPase